MYLWFFFSPENAGLKMVKTWYNVQVGSDVLILCTIGIELATSDEKFSDDKIKIDHNATWR
jgi:hypothetical protein